MSKDKPVTTFPELIHEEILRRNTGVNSGSAGQSPKDWSIKVPTGFYVDPKTLGPGAFRAQANNSWDYSIPKDFWKSTIDEVVAETKCECGSEKTYGNSISAGNHSDYCPVFKKWMNEGKK